MNFQIFKFQSLNFQIWTVVWSAQDKLFSPTFKVRQASSSQWYSEENQKVHFWRWIFGQLFIWTWSQLVSVKVVDQFSEISLRSSLSPLVFSLAVVKPDNCWHKEIIQCCKSLWKSYHLACVHLLIGLDLHKCSSQTVLPTLI